MSHLYISKLFCRPHPDGSKFENPTTYIPAEMALLPKSKIGVSVGWQTKRGRRKVFKKSIRTLPLYTLEFEIIPPAAPRYIRLTSIFF